MLDRVGDGRTVDCCAPAKLGTAGGGKSLGRFIEKRSGLKLGFPVGTSSSSDAPSKLFRCQSAKSAYWMGSAGKSTLFDSIRKNFASSAKKYLQGPGVTDDVVD